jgi:hypothetical protein
MSTYNEYLHGDFRRLGFPDYIKMLDGELRLKDVSVLSLREDLPAAPFFGKYSTEFRFALFHPSEESGKRPFISLIQSNLLDAAVEERQLAILHTRIYHHPLPSRLTMIDDIVQSFENHLRHNLSVLDRVITVDPGKELEELALQVVKRR